jgi:hypothetical protein
MAPGLHTENIWPRITKLCRTGRAFVAVAFLGKGARKLLPLRRGSVLVVNASEGCVKQGQTCPAELMKFVRAGVDVHSAPDLHAKVFAFPKSAIVGSTNASKSSAKYWHEAVVISGDSRLVKQAREFVLDVSGERLPMKRLEQLNKLYQPPRGGPKPGVVGKRRRSKQASSPERSPLWAVNVEVGRWDAHDDVQAERGRPAATERLRRGEELDEFAYQGAETARLQRGAQVVQIVHHGKRTIIAPVGTIVGRRAFRVGKHRTLRAIMFVAAPEGRRGIELSRAKKRLGGDAKVLSTGANLRLVRDRAVSQAIRQLWRPR